MLNELSAFVSSLQDIHYKFNVICLQECWISNLTDLSNIQLPGYDCIAKGKSCSKNGGLIIYVDNRFQYEVQLNINTYEYWEGLIIKVTGVDYQKQLLLVTYTDHWVW